MFRMTAVRGLSIPLKFERLTLKQLKHLSPFVRQSTSVKTGKQDDIYPAKISTGGKSTKAAFEDYRRAYELSIKNPDLFWSEQAKRYLTWYTEPHTITSGGFAAGDIRWFEGGKLNVSYNCIDRHLAKCADQIAIIWEADDPCEGRSITYSELSTEVSKIANVMKAQGVKKGDVVTIYMPMIPEIAFVMLACARIGAVHSVVFAGFSSDSLKDRILDGNSKWVFTADEGKRGGKNIPLKETVDDAIIKCKGSVKNVFVFKRTGKGIHSFHERDIIMNQALQKAQPHCEPEHMDSEDNLFVLYTSGSTGKPKGVAHTTAGYLLNATMTTHTTFDLQHGDIYCCAADCGWITGHSYIIYGPLSNGTTTVMFESIPTYPNPYRYWDMIQKHKITQFYTAPTAIRALMRYDTSPIKNYDLSSLRVLGSVGEPINPEAWKWYYNHAGRGNCTIVDTYWQTETGTHLSTNLPGVAMMKPGSCALPCYGIDLVVLDPVSGKELDGPNVEGVLAIKSPWPSIARTVHGDHDRYLNVYTRPYPGYYFTGDGCRRDQDGYYFITGRVDDVINPSGHRLGTAEIESVLISCQEVSESAVVGFPHDIKGEGIACYVILKDGVSPSESLTSKLKDSVRQAIGPIATPDYIVYSDLPKTRSGKIMRRILRKIAAGEYGTVGDISTLADPTVVQRLVEKVKEVKTFKS